MRLSAKTVYIPRVWRDSVPAVRGSNSEGRRGRHPARATITILTLFMLVFTTAGTADSFNDGLEAYSAENYTSAVSKFEAALNESETAAARHNLALSYYQLEQPAEAAWQIERALVLEPHNREYRYKLDALRQELGLFASSANWFKLTAQSLTLQQWVLLGAASIWFALASIFLPKMSGRTPGLGIKFLRTISLVVIAAALAGSILTAPIQQTGILVINETQDLHAAPASVAPISGTVRPAERAQQLDQHGEFVKIETEGGATGWIQRDKFRNLIN